MIKWDKKIKGKKQQTVIKSRVPQNLVVKVKNDGKHLRLIKSDKGGKRYRTLSYERLARLKSKARQIFRTSRVADKLDTLVSREGFTKYINKFTVGRVVRFKGLIRTSFKKESKTVLIVRKKYQTYEFGVSPIKDYLSEGDLRLHEIKRKWLVLSTRKDRRKGRIAGFRLREPKLKKQYFGKMETPLEKQAKRYTEDFFSNFFREEYPQEKSTDYKVIIKRLFSGIVPVDLLKSLSREYKVIGVTTNFRFDPVLQDFIFQYGFI
jgi:hypothetical protein